VFSFVTVRIPPPAIEFFVGICFGMTKALSRRYQQTVREAASGGCPQAFEESGIEVQLLTPFKADARPDEFSRLQVRCYGRKVLGLRRSKGKRRFYRCVRGGRLGRRSRKRATSGSFRV